MGRIDLIAGDWHAALAALDWQVDLGVDVAVQDAPVNRYDAVAEVPRPTAAPMAVSALPAAGPVAAAPPAVDAVAQAVASAGRATTLAGLRAALDEFPHCELRRGARNMVFAAGLPGARVMVVGDAPDSDDDRQATPFAGGKGVLLDAMFAAIGLRRDAGDPAQAIYVTTALPWRPAGTPDAADVAMLRPFLMQHIALAAPRIVVALGTDAVHALLPDAPLARGAWGQVLGRPLLAMQHPAVLLRTPAQKRDAWADMLALKARLAQMGA